MAPSSPGRKTDEMDTPEALPAHHPRRLRAGAAMAGALAVVGTLVAIDRHDRGCFDLTRRAVDLGLARDDTAAQSWDDIYVLQTDVTEGLRLRHELTTRCS
jgi:hypothetical protein